MKIEVTLDDEAVEAMAAALAKAMGSKPANSRKKSDGKGKAEAASPAPAEAEDTGDELGEAAEASADEAEDFGENEPAAVTSAEVLTALKAVSGHKKLGQDTAMDILKSVGKASKLSALAEGKFAAVLKACNDAVAKAK